MKKLLLLAAVGASAATLTACKKEAYEDGSYITYRSGAHNAAELSQVKIEITDGVIESIDIDDIRFMDAWVITTALNSSGRALDAYYRPGIQTCVKETSGTNKDKTVPKETGSVYAKYIELDGKIYGATFSTGAACDVGTIERAKFEGYFPVDNKGNILEGAVRFTALNQERAKEIGTALAAGEVKMLQHKTLKDHTTELEASGAFITHYTKKQLGYKPGANTMANAMFKIEEYITNNLAEVLKGDFGAYAIDNKGTDWAEKSGATVTHTNNYFTLAVDAIKAIPVIKK